MKNNLKIIGEVSAVPGSWPSIAYIMFNYKSNYLLPIGVTVLVTAQSYCAGTLISTRKILTAAHCIPTSITFTYLGKTYTGSVTPNTFYPTFASMFFVYLGVHNRSSLINSGTFTAPTIRMSVQDITKV